MKLSNDQYNTMMSLRNSTPSPDGSLLVATSYYFSNVCSLTPDAWSSAPAMRGLISRGLLEGDCGWRCYQVKLTELGKTETLYIK